jgi:hypothetical protein
LLLAALRFVTFRTISPPRCIALAHCCRRRAADGEKRENMFALARVLVASSSQDAGERESFLTENHSGRAGMGTLKRLVVVNVSFAAAKLGERAR